MTGPIAEIALILLLVVANGALAMSEIAIVSARPERLRAMVQDGRAGARAAMALAQDPNRFLSTIQIGITLVGILAGAFGGATVAERLSGVLDNVPWFAAYSGAVSLGIVVVAIAYLSLVIGELVPKRLAMRGPEQVASTVAPAMTLLSLLAFPVVRVLSISTDAVLRLLRASSSVQSPVTEEEIKLLVGEGARAGVFEAGEHQMVTEVFRLHDRPVQVFMTPRTDIEWLDVNSTRERVRRALLQTAYSRLPVCDGELDRVTGLVSSKDLLNQLLSGADLDLQAASQPPLFIPESATGSQVVQLFRQSRTSVGLVVDEHGGVEGLVTDTDVLEEIAGVIEGDEEVIVHEEGVWVLDGRVGMDELRDLTGINMLVPPEEQDAYHTVGGFVLARLGHAPSVGDTVSSSGVRFQVREIDGLRISRVEVSVERSHADDHAPDGESSAQ